MREQRHRLGPDVERHPPCFHSVSVHDAQRLPGLHPARADQIDRKQQLAPSLVGHLLRLSQRGILDESAAGPIAARLEERVGHRAADDQSVDLLQQVAEHPDLGRDLGAADHREHRAPRVVQRLVQRRQLGFHQLAREGGKVSGDSHDRSMRAVRGAEGVVHVQLPERRQPVCEFRVVRLLLGVKAHVLQQQNLAVLELGDGSSRRLADTVLCEMHLAVECARQVHRDGPQREIGFHALGPTEVRHDDDLGSALGQVEEGRHGRANPGVVADRSLRHRHVEVLAHKDALARNVDRCDRSLQSVATPKAPQIRGIGGRRQGKGGAARSASWMRDDAAPGPLTPPSAPQAPGRLGREDASDFGGATLTATLPCTR